MSSRRAGRLEEPGAPSVRDVSGAPGTCPLDCPDACGTLALRAPDGTLARLRGDPAHPWSQGSLCGKTALYHELVHSPERVLTPLVRERGRLREASWEEALARIAARVGPLVARGVGERILALWYGGTMGLVQRKVPLRVMHALGATLVDGTICDATSEAGHRAVLGDLVGPPLEELERSDLVLLWGIDAVRTMPHLVPRVDRAQAAGGHALVIDVYGTASARRVEQRGGEAFLIRPGSDGALALWLAREAFERGRVDRARLARECLGGERFEQLVRAGHDAAWAARETGLAPERLERLRTLLFEARAPFWKLGVGFARRANGGRNARAIGSLAAVLGCAERLHFMSADLFELAEEPLTRPDLRSGGKAAPKISHVGVGEALCAGRFDAVFVWCHDPVAVVPDARAVRDGLAREQTFVVVHELVRSETAELADVVLPATAFVEHEDLYRSYGQRVLRRARKACEPPGPGPDAGPRSNVEAFAAIARALGLPEEVWRVDAASLIDAVLDASGRLSAEQRARLDAGEAVELAPRPGRARGTPSGRIELVTTAPDGGEEWGRYVADEGLGRGAFRLHAAPSVHTHNATYLHSPRHRKKAGGARCFLAPSELARLGLADGARVRLANERASLTLVAHADADLPVGLVRVDGLFLASETPEGLGLNALVPPAQADLAGGSVLYSTRVDVLPA